MADGSATSGAMAGCDGRGFDHNCQEPATQADGRCVFHSESPDKPHPPLREALGEMRRTGEFRCSGWVFPFDVDLRGQELRQGNFSGATFQGTTGFEGATFQGSAWFRGAAFQGTTWFRDAVFQGTAGFRGAAFQGDAEFVGATFQGDADFGDAAFQGDAEFVGAAFQGDAEFVGATFQGDAWFVGATFQGDAWFDGAGFEKGPSFRGARFIKPASFDESRFQVHTTLDRTYFGPDCSFNRADLQLLTFRRCWMGGVSLSEAYKAAQAEYDECAWGRWRARNPVLGRFLRPIYRRLRGRSPWRWILRWALRYLPPGQMIQGVVYEEGEARRRNGRGDYQRAERVYREVGHSLEDHKHYQEAHRFGYRELEMRRLALLAGRNRWWGRLWGQARANLLSFEAWYHHLSGYGQSWWKPLVWLVMVLALSPLLFAWAGADLGQGGYRLAPLGGETTWDGKAYVDLLKLALSSAALLPDPTGAPQNLGAFFTQILLRLLGPFLAILFTLAVRRRFRR